MKMRSIAVTTTALTLAAAGIALARDYDAAGPSSPAASSPAHALYVQECGACHLAYPAGLLPARSWQQVMAGLGDHFGDNAELAPEDARVLEDYLVAHAADAKRARRTSATAASAAAERAPMRITELRWFRDEHEEIPARLVAGNSAVKSLGRCEVCHTQAQAGSFDEHQIKIPGYGRWED